MRALSSRRGVSEILAALLVICITVAAATLLAAYASGLMGNLQTRVAQPYTEQLTLEYYNWLNAKNNAPPQLIIRNDGAATITLADFFMQGMRNTTSITFANCYSKPYVLPVQQSCTVTFPVPTGLTITPYVTYTVKFVASDGAIFTFTLVAGSNTH